MTIREFITGYAYSRIEREQQRLRSQKGFSSEVLDKLMDDCYDEATRIKGINKYGETKISFEGRVRVANGAQAYVLENFLMGKFYFVPQWKKIVHESEI